MLSSFDTYLGAKSQAVLFGGHRAVIDDADEQAWIHANVVPSLSYYGYANAMWIGLSDLSLEGTFMWANGAPVSYTNWHSGEPNDFGGKDGVTIVYDAGSGSYSWYDFTTSDVRFGIAERRLNLSITAYAGPGSVRLSTATPYAGQIAVTIVTLNTAGAGTGWFYGINESLLEVVNQVSTFAPPFFNVLGGSGSSVYQLASGVPAGIPVAAVSVIFDGSFQPLDATAPVLYTTF